MSLQDLRRKIYRKAKAEPAWRFWGLYVHVCKLETLREAYRLAHQNNGAPGSDGVTFAAIEADGIEAFLQLRRDELLTHTYRPQRLRHVEIPKAGGKGVRVLSIPTIRDRVVQGALKLILEPIFEADFQPGSYGYRPKRSAHEAVQRVAEAIVHHKTRVLDIDLYAYFDNIRHPQVIAKVARRVNDGAVLHLLKLILKASGKKGVAQGGVLSVLSNLYLNEVDQMLERAKEVTRRDSTPTWSTAGSPRPGDFSRCVCPSRLATEGPPATVERGWPKSGRDEYREESAGGPQQRGKLRISGL
jgi:RNA-directed DNA polymerase